MLFFFFKPKTAYQFVFGYLNSGVLFSDAMASGTPVLCSDSSCFPEIAGPAASFFSQNDSDDFTKKLFEIIIDPEKKNELIIKGKKRAADFSWEKCAKETLKVYQDV